MIELKNKGWMSWMSRGNCNILVHVLLCSLYILISSCVSLLFSSVVGLDIQDEMGRHEVGHIDNSMKIPLNQGDGCRFEGEFTINKVREEEQ